MNGFVKSILVLPGTLYRKYLYLFLCVTSAQQSMWDLLQCLANFLDPGDLLLYVGTPKPTSFVRKFLSSS